MPLGGEYEIIYADPPWDRHFRTTVDNEPRYPTMSTEDIAALDVPASDDCILFLWCNAWQLDAGLEVIDGWGFEYKTSAVWDKRIMGIGHWFRGQHEVLFLGTRGDVSPPDTRNRHASVFSERRSDRHSEKPGCVISWIDEAYPDKSKVELFAREAFVGWDVWGNETPDTKQARL